MDFGWDGMTLDREPKQNLLFCDQESIITVKLYRNKRGRQGRPWAAIDGYGPVGECCGTCKFIKRTGHTVKTYFKCGKRPITSGPGTDIRKKDPACFVWARQEGKC